MISAESKVECHVLSGQCSYLLVGIMEFCMCPQGVQKDRSSFAGLVGGIAGERERCLWVSEKQSLAIPFTFLKSPSVRLQQLPLVTQGMSFESQSSLKRPFYKS